MRFRSIVVSVLLVAAAAPPAAARATAPQPVATATPAGTSNSELSGVSCPSDGDCVAVGAWQTPDYHRFGLIETYDGTRWHLTETHVLSNLRPVRLQSVACADPGDCLAVGGATVANATAHRAPVARAVAIQEVGGRWHRRLPPHRVHGVTIDTLTDVACPVASDCEAIGDGTAGGRRIGVIARLHDGRWRVTARGLPGARATTLQGLSCSGPGSCDTTEDATVFDRSGAHDTVGLLTLSHGHWHRVALHLDQDPILDSVTCPPDGECLLFGRHARPGPGPIALRIAGRQTAPLPAAPPISGQAFQVGRLICATATQCLAVGSIDATDDGTRQGARGMIAFETWDGGGFAPAFAGSPVRLLDVACRPSFCLLVGSHARAAASARWAWSAPVADGRPEPALRPR